MQVVYDQLEQLGLNNIVLGLGAVILVLFIYIAALHIRFKKVSKKFHSFLNQSKVENLQDLVLDFNRRLQASEGKNTLNETILSDLNKKIQEKKGNIGIHRYNAFSFQENNQSFAVAIMDDKSSGIVLNVLNNENGYYIYAKAVENGDSDHKLSPDEKIAIKVALNQK